MSAKGGANLPLARVKTIMKSSPEVENVNQESLFLVTRATVSFYKSQFRKRQFVRVKSTQKNASNFAIFIEKEKAPCFFFVFHFEQVHIFTLQMPTYVEIFHNFKNPKFSLNFRNFSSCI